MNQRAILLAALAVFILASPAEARRRVHHHRAAHHHVHYGDGRPAAWCGWFMARHIYGRDVRRLWLAANWAQEGRAVSGPVEGAIGVAAHHVVQVIKVLGRGRILAISGNDGHQVRTRERSTRGIFAWRVV